MRGRKAKSRKVVTLENRRAVGATDPPSYLRVAEKRLWEENVGLVPYFDAQHRHLLAQWCITLNRLTRLERGLYSPRKLVAEGASGAEKKAPRFSALLMARQDWLRCNRALGLTPGRSKAAGEKPPIDQTEDNVLDGNF